MPENTSFPSPLTAISSPGALLANIPGILGFYPMESVVFTAMFQKEHSHSFELGPVIRVGLDELKYLPDISRALAAADTDMVFAFVIASEINSLASETAVDLLFENSRPELMDIVACWVTSGIYSGETYHLAFGPPPDALEEDTSGFRGWENGRIPPITEAAATQSMLRGGFLPEVTRDEAFAVFDHGNPEISSHNLHELNRRTYAEAAELMKGISEEPGNLESVIAAFGELLKRCTGKKLAEVLSEGELLGHAGAYLCTPLTRDAVLHFFIEEPTNAATVALALAKTFDGLVRANALCLYSLAVVTMNLGMKANPALEAALRTRPGHNLGVLLRQGLNEGRFEETIEACMRGNAMVREKNAENAGKGHPRSDHPDTTEAA